MKTIWKWILGIVIVLVIIAVPLVLHYAFGYQFGFGIQHAWVDRHAPIMNAPRTWENEQPWHGFDGRGIRPHGFGFMPFFGPLTFFIGLVKLAFFGLLLYGAYWLGRRNAHVVISPAPSDPKPGQTPRPAPRKVAK
jgi:hypothetical protein